jgi:predicted phage terminase large subunit-like protein
MGKLNTKLIQAGKAKLIILRQQAWDDFYIFAKYVTGYNLMEEQPHREVCEFLMAGLEDSERLNLNIKPVYTSEYVINKCNKILKKLVMLPRNSFKSTVVTQCLVIWLLWHNQDLRIMIDSETLGNGKLYLAGIKDQIENNERLKLICTNEKGEYLLEPNKKIAGGFTEEGIILLHRKKLGMKEPTIFCSGVDNARTGMHPDVIIMDDLVSERNVGTETQLNKVKDHYRFSLSLLEVGGLQIVVGTRYHMADLYSELVESESFDKLIRPAIGEDGELFFPTRLSHEYLAEMRREQGVYIFNSQYMLNPIDDTSATFKKANIQYFIDTPPLVAKYILIDLAISKKQTADYTVVMTIGITHDKKIYILEYDRGRYNPRETLDAIFSAYRKHSQLVKVVGIETVAYQKAMLYLIQDEMRRTGTYLPLKELKADMDKTRRITALQPLFEMGDVFIRPNMKELEQELLEFPYSRHDDTLDSLAYILQVLRAGNTKGQTRQYQYRPASKTANY